MIDTIHCNCCRTFYSRDFLASLCLPNNNLIWCLKFGCLILHENSETVQEPKIQRLPSTTVMTDNGNPNLPVSMTDGSIQRSSKGKWKMPIFVFFRDARYVEVWQEKRKEFHGFSLIDNCKVMFPRLVFKMDALGLEILQIAFPAALALAADPVASLIDTAFIGRLGLSQHHILSLKQSVTVLWRNVKIIFWFWYVCASL